LVMHVADLHDQRSRANCRTDPSGHLRGIAWLLIELAIAGRDIRTREVGLEHLRAGLSGPGSALRVVVGQSIERPARLDAPHYRHSQDLARWQLAAGPGHVA